MDIFSKNPEYILCVSSQFEEDLSNTKLNVYCLNLENLDQIKLE